MVELTSDTLRECVVYDPSTGIFTWRPDRPSHHFKNKHGMAIWKSRYAGKRAGKSGHTNGYRRIALWGKDYYAHRLVFLYMTGKWPAEEVDHLDGDRLNNRWDNLIETNRKGNCVNKSMSSINKSGCNGVSWCGTANKWRATAVRNRKSIHLGYFKCYHDAVDAREGWQSSQEDYTKRHGKRLLHGKND